MSNMFLSENDCRIIHGKTLELLEKTGIKLLHKEAEILLLKAGAKEDGDRILIPGKLVEETLKLNTPEIRIYDKNRNEAMLLKSDGESNFGSGSDALYQIDIDTEKKRFSRISDIERNIRLLDKLDQFNFVMSTGLPQPTEILDEILYKSVFEAMSKNTSKPIVTTLSCCRDLRQVHEVALDAVGDTLKEKPYFLVYNEPISPLLLDEEGVDRVLYCAEHEIPFIFAAGANSGSGAPITLEGSIIQGSAEFLAGYVLAKLKNPKALLLYGANTSAINLRTMRVRYGAPEWFKTVAVYADLARFYNMPSWGTGGCSDALKLGELATWEAQQGISVALESGSSLVHDVGYFDHGNIYDPRMLLLTNEMIKRERFLRKPLNWDNNYIDEAIEAIDEVSKTEGLIFAAHMHTGKYFRKSIYIPESYLWPDKDYAKSLGDEVKKLWT
jgi:trimethylamine---corrinoid protein Co-methyltransferase